MLLEIAAFTDNLTLHTKMQMMLSTRTGAERLWLIGAPQLDVDHVPRIRYFFTLDWLSNVLATELDPEIKDDVNEIREWAYRTGAQRILLTLIYDTDQGSLVNAAAEEEEQKREYEEDCQYLAYAEAHYASEGDLEFDDTAVVSRGDDPGAYVQGWKWVSAEDAGVEVDEEEE